MQAPANLPPPIRTDGTNEFAAHTMRVRIPAIVQQTLDVNPKLPVTARSRLAQLRDDIAQGRAIAPLKYINRHAAEDHIWLSEHVRRSGETWHATDWFFAEIYVYRLMMEAVSYLEHGLDPFAPIKHAEYASAEHRAFLQAALALDLAPERKLHALVGSSLWGNRADLSYAESRSHGTAAADSDLLHDDRAAVVERLMRGRGDLHLVTDNAGTELSADLVLVDAVLSLGLSAHVCLHVKSHPTFVSDVVEMDVRSFVLGCERGLYGAPAQALGTRLHGYLRANRLTIRPDGYWNSARFWWNMPVKLADLLGDSALVVVKGDANYRRLVGDALWPLDTPFSQVVGGFGYAVLVLRTLKSDPLVGISSAAAATAQSRDSRWRWSGRLGVIQAHIS